MNDGSRKLLDEWAKQEGEPDFESLKIKWFVVVENSDYDTKSRELLNQRIYDLEKLAKLVVVSTRQGSGKMIYRKCTFCSRDAKVCYQCIVKEVKKVRQKVFKQIDDKISTLYANYRNKLNEKCGLKYPDKKDFRGWELYGKMGGLAEISCELKELKK